MIYALIDLLSTFYQAGNLEQIEAISRSMLSATPDDLVALQFLGLAMYQTGRIDDAYAAFKRVAARTSESANFANTTTCESTATVSYREAIRPGSGLADGWQKIAQIMTIFGFRKSATSAYAAAITARSVDLEVDEVTLGVSQDAAL